MELWTDLALNSFLANILFTRQSEYMLFGFAAFDHPSKWLALLVSSVAGTLGQMMNFLAGWLLVCFKDKKWFVLDDEHYSKLQRIVRRFGVWILLFQHLPLYSIFPLIIGFFRAKPLFAASLIFVGIIVHDAMAMLSIAKIMGYM